MTIQLKRAYDDPEPSDGLRILVDRLWPRGVSKERAQLDFWAKEVSPSNELRKTFGHDADRWDAFKRSYFAELDSHPEAVRDLLERIEGQQATLIYAAKGRERNNAVALREYLLGRSTASATG
ncbi:MAG: DUF488 domain-containing protein [Anaerolineales bacterium]